MPRSSRRQFLNSTLAGALAPAMQAQKPERPNIVVMLADDLGCRDLGCYGASDLKTPHIDRIAREGVRFDNWYSAAPVCAPARGALMTGRYPIRCGMPTNGLNLPAYEKTFASLLKQHGYATGLTGKWHLGSTPETVPNAHGFDYFYGFLSGCVDFYSHRYYWGEPRRVNYHDLWRNRTEIFEDGQYLTERLGEEAEGFIERSRNQPFLLYLPFNAVHYPMHAPQKYVDRFGELEPERRMYAAMLSSMDDAVGRVLGTLDRFNLTRNTMVVYLGDNGATTEKRAGLAYEYATAGRNGDFRGFKFSLFDGGMHVPCVMRWPAAIQPGQINKEVCSSMDILPTACAAAGAALPTDRTIDGRNLVPLLREGEASPHEAIFWAQGKQMALRRGKWKLVVNGATYEGRPDGNKPLEGDDGVFLSDLEQDPRESHNLRRKYPELTDELQSMLYRWREDVQGK